MPPRKTLRVRETVLMLNEMLKDSTGSADFRDGICTAIEHVLHSTGNYCGFRYLEAVEVPYGHAPGIYWHSLTKDPIFTNTDASRRHYFMPPMIEHG